MDCIFTYWKRKLAWYFEMVEEFQVTPLPPPPPPPPAKVSFADYVTMVAKWELNEFAPVIGSACG